MRSSLAPAQPGDLREVSYQLLALSHLLENKSPEETYRFDPKHLSRDLGRILEELALDVDGIADNWERRSLRGAGGQMGSVDLSPLIHRVLVLIGLSMALGQYGRLETWAGKQAMAAMQPGAWPELQFFPRNYGVKSAIDRYSVIHYN